MGIITGGANGDWVHAKRDGLDSYLTGGSQSMTGMKPVNNIHFFAGGNNATEQFGVQYLLKYLQAKYSDCEYQFISSDNPA